MRYRTLGKTGLQVSEIGFGGWAIAGNRYGDSYGPTEDAVSLAALNRAYELGCTFFHTADVFGHGHGETLIGEALKGWRREEVVIATQGGQDFSGEAVKPNFSETALRQAVDASLRRLGVEAIDVYQLHTPPLELIQHGKVFEVLQDLKQAGKIRTYGVSIQDPQEGIQAIRLGAVDTVMAIWNLFDRRIEKALLEACREHRTGLLVREPLARGVLAEAFREGMTFGKGDHRAVWPRPFVSRRIQAAGEFRKILPEGYDGLDQLALGYALHDPAVSCVVAGCKTPEQVARNMAASDRPPLTSDQLREVARVYSGIFGSP